MNKFSPGWLDKIKSLFRKKPADTSGTLGQDFADGEESEDFRFQTGEYLPDENETNREINTDEEEPERTASDFYPPSPLNDETSPHTLPTPPPFTEPSMAVPPDFKLNDDIGYSDSITLPTAEHLNLDEPVLISDIPDAPPEVHAGWSDPQHTATKIEAPSPELEIPTAEFTDEETFKNPPEFEPIIQEVGDANGDYSLPEYTLATEHDEEVEAANLSHDFQPREALPKTSITLTSIRAAAQNFKPRDFFRRLPNRLERLPKIIRDPRFHKGSTAAVWILSLWLLSSIVAQLAFDWIPAEWLNSPTGQSAASFAARNNRGPVKPQLSDYDIIVSRNLFNSRGLIPGESNTDPSQWNTGPAVKSSLPLQLIGTIIFANPKKSLATLLETNSRAVYPVRADDEVVGKIRVLEVERARVVFINLENRRKEYVELAEEDASSLQVQAKPRNSAKTPMKPASASSVKMSITRAELNTNLANFKGLLTQAKAVPVEEGGQTIGYQLVQVDAGSFYEKIGLKKDDIIVGFNGEKVPDAAKAMMILGELKTMGNISVKVRRPGGQTVDLNYDIQ